MNKLRFGDIPKYEKMENVQKTDLTKVLDLCD